MNADLIQVIRTDLDLRGEGKPGDPVRRVVQFWSTDGQLLAEVDPGAPSPSKVKRLIAAAKFVAGLNISGAGELRLALEALEASND